LIVVAVLTLFAAVAAGSGPAASTANRWAESTRGILAQHCGQCHLPNLPTSVPRALAVFNLTEEPWYGRMTNEQLDSLLPRVQSIRGLPESEVPIVERFVLCARDRDCPPTGP
jgi:mono/diheme cytochrome c family protein